MPAPHQPHTTRPYLTNRTDRENARALRSALPPAQRRPFFMHIDEAPDYINLPISLSVMLAQLRKYGGGLTLAFPVP